MRVARGESPIITNVVEHHSCQLSQELGRLDQDALIPVGVFTLDDIKAYGIKHGICPYFAVRRMVSCLNSTIFERVGLICLFLLKLPKVSVIIYSFHYLLDPKVAEQVSKEIGKEAIVVFDEAHNIGKL